MKGALAFIAIAYWSLALGAQVPPASVNFQELEAAAPKGYPTAFVVREAVMHAGTSFVMKGCSMNLETADKIYYVSDGNAIKNCKVFPPGTVIYGHVHKILGTVVDLLDTTGSKPKTHRYDLMGTTPASPVAQ